MTDTSDGGVAVGEPVVFERLIDASPDEVFVMFTQPERLRRWLVVSGSVDLRAGGDFRFTVVPSNIATGVFTEVVPGKHLALTWGWVGHEKVPPGASSITIDFEPVGHQTLVRLTHSGLDDEAAREHKVGWTHYLERLIDLVSTGKNDDYPWAASSAGFDHLDSAEASWAVCQVVMRNLRPVDGGSPTPCEGFTVRQLISHLEGSIRALGAIAGATYPESLEGEHLAGETLDSEPFEDRIARVVEPTLAAWRERGLEGKVPFGGNEVAATLPSGILSLEFLVHAWDFAQVTEQHLDVPAPLIAFVDHIARSTITPANRGEGRGFAPEASAKSEEPLERLIAFTGRTT